MFDTEIIDYIDTHYQPLGIIVYGSFADGSNNDHSDFDALIITKTGEKARDITVVHHTKLDVFVYPSSCFGEKTDWSDFVQLYDGVIVKDTDGIAAYAIEQVKKYIDGTPFKTREENRVNIEWCEKMRLRAERGDDEGFFRWHWLLTDSLEIYFDTIGSRYWGPKKSLRKLKQADPEGAEIYSRALRCLNHDTLKEWIVYLRSVFEANV